MTTEPIAASAEQPTNARQEKTESTQQPTVASDAPASKKEKKPKTGPAPSDKKGNVDGEPSNGAPKLSNAELKAKAKAEKAARRAQAKAAAPPKAAPDAAKDKKGAKADGHQGPLKPARRMSMAQEAKPTIPECFSHLSMARRIPISQADKDVNPAVLALGQQMASFTLTDSIARLQATLIAFKKVIESYTTPPGNSFSRHFTSHVLNPQVEYLTACRPMCFSMGNAVRWLKLRISKIDIDLSDIEAKRELCDSIDTYIEERISFADRVITVTGAGAIKEGDVVLTYACHRMVEKVIRQAHSLGKQFEVVIIDDPFEKQGQNLAQALSKDGLPVSYYPSLGGIELALERATKVIFGAEALFSNGSMYAKAGSSDIALCAIDHHIPVIALCHSVNITDRVSIDSLTYNEIDPDQHTNTSFRLLFDTTREKYLTAVITEIGSAPAKSVPCIHRRWEEM